MYGPIVHKSGQNVGKSYIMYGMYEVLIFPVMRARGMRPLQFGRRTNLDSI
jgi:hypothetical protein